MNPITKRNIPIIASYILLLYPVLPIFGRSLVTGLWIFMAVFYLILIKKKGIFQKSELLLFLFASLYLCYAISLFYSTNIATGLTYLFRRIPLILFPLLFFLIPFHFSKKEKEKLLIYFGFINIVFSAFVIILLLIKGIVVQLSEVRNPVVYLRHQIEHYTDLHPSYLSLFLGFTFLIYLILLIDQWKTLPTFKRNLLLIALVYVLAFMLMLSAKMSIVSVMAISLIILIKKIQNKPKALIGSFLLILFCSLLAFINPTTKIRFEHLIKAFTMETSNVNNPDSIRIEIYKCAKVVIKENVLFGVGLGDQDDVLFKQYRYDNLKKAARNKMNTHNQYLEIWISSGLIALLLFILSLLVSVFLSYLHKDYYYFAFITLISLCLLTENILSRQVGVLFFAFFNSLFAFNQANKEDTVFINARFLTKKVTGVQRFACEISTELIRSTNNLKFLVPGKIRVNYPIDRANYEIIKPFQSHLWEQITLPLYLSTIGKPLLINLENTAPVLYKHKITTIHDVSFLKSANWFSKPYNLLYRFLIPRICATSHKILTVSNFSKRELIKHYGLNEEKIEIIHNATPGALIKREEAKENSGYKNYILTVGSLEPRKNLKTLINAFSELHNDYQLIIVGDFNQKIFNKTNLHESVNQNKKIKVLPNVSDQELIFLYTNATCFVYVPLYEGFGLPVMEAMYFGCPTLISDIEVFREIYMDAAIYVAPDNSIGISNKLMELINDVDLRKKYIQAGYLQVKKYSYEQSANKIRTVIAQTKKAYDG